MHKLTKERSSFEKDNYNFVNGCIYYDVNCFVVADSNALKSVVSREFGHVLGLDENGTTQIVMNYKTWGYKSRYGYYGITSPRADDKAGVNAKY